MSTRNKALPKHAKSERRRNPIAALFKFIGCILLLVVVLACGLLAYLSLTEYKPADSEKLAVEENSGKESAVRNLSRDEKFTIMSWNVGYGALGDNADFFMDGGKMVDTADIERLNSNLDGIKSEIRSIDPDFLFTQEIDVDSKRSHHVNEYEMLHEEFPDMSASFANNFKVEFLPFPVPPIGKVDSGIATYSGYSVSSAERVQLPIPFKWPVRMANLKRCLLVSRVDVEGTDKELVLINLHLEAFDDGDGKIAQTGMLRELLESEAAKGNYVIAGGDFNQRFTSTDPDVYPLLDGTWHPGTIDVKDFGSDWQCLMDDKAPSCRSNDKPYAGADHDTFQYYIVDGFIVSSNIKVESFGTHDLDFVSSDHNPIVLKASLK